MSKKNEININLFGFNVNVDVDEVLDNIENGFDRNKNKELPQSSSQDENLSNN